PIVHLELGILDHPLPRFLVLLILTDTVLVSSLRLVVGRLLRLPSLQRRIVRLTGGGILFLLRSSGTRCWVRRSLRLTARFSDADRKSTRLNSSHVSISYAVFCLK